MEFFRPEYWSGLPSLGSHRVGHDWSDLAAAAGIKWQISSVQELSHVWFFATLQTAVCQASVHYQFRSLLKLMSIESVMPSNHLILCHPLLLPPSIFPSIKVFSKELVLHIRWSRYWSFSFNINSSSEYSGLISFRMDWLDLLAEIEPAS